jgi:hypothetical protein
LHITGARRIGERLIEFRESGELRNGSRFGDRRALLNLAIASCAPRRYVVCQGSVAFQESEYAGTVDGRENMASNHRWTCWLLFACVCWCGIVRAGEGPFEDQFTFDLGTYFMGSQTSIRADELDGIDLGTRFRIEDVFEMQDETVFRLEGAWRFKPRHALRLMYFDSSRSRTDTIDRNIEFGDEQYPVGASVKLQYDFTVTELAYRYSLMTRDNFELGGSVGVHNIDFGLKLSATLSAPVGQGSYSAEESASTNAPLPVFGLNMTWHLAKDVYLLAHAQYFQIEYGDLDGRLMDYQASVLWQFSEHFGVGAAYNSFMLEVGANDADSFRGELDWEYSGPQLFLRASF